ncbi:hypothetical protein GCM10010383_55530 [Streptomyces lomondensis]|uniref:Uncharacterized protein n=1 Tax=Streptomyces lomondensis TaxID=68229 RepID=A0ABQ2XI82_9ACTN|nr:hypothetical protein GCM10010383_55530 [Streptomyces lomondensis]
MPQERQEPRPATAWRLTRTVVQQYEATCLAPGGDFSPGARGVVGLIMLHGEGPGRAPGLRHGLTAFAPSGHCFLLPCPVPRARGPRPAVRSRDAAFRRRYTNPAAAYQGCVVER